MSTRSERIFTDPAEFKFDDSRDQIFSEACENQMPARVRTWETEAGQEARVLELDFRNGDSIKRVPIGSERATALLGRPFYQWEFLGDYWALYYPELRMIEAAFEREAELRGFPRNKLILLPNIERYNHEEADPAEFTRRDGGTVSGPWYITEFDGMWRVQLSDSSTSVEIEMSPMMPNRMPKLVNYSTERTHFPWPHPSLKIKNIDPMPHDALLALLRDYSGSIIFELDLRYSIFLRLARTRVFEYTFLGDKLTGPAIEIPRNRYAPAAIELYFYARSASGMPLLEYLAYYQAIEYFFPGYWNAEVARRVRHKLKDPRFNLNNSADIANLIALATAGSKSGQPSEREQLRATIESCVTEEDLRGFIEQDQSRLEFLASKESIHDAHTINTKNPTTTMAAQVSNRVYDLRCRIVHGKSDGGRPQAGMLLPLSPESQRLKYDIELIRFVAQEVIVDSVDGTLR